MHLILDSYLPFFTLAGLGAIGVGFFPETTGMMHVISAFTAFSFGGLSAIVSYKIQKPPLSYFSVLLGVLSLVALTIYGSGTFLGLGKGGMERMIVYPTMGSWFRRSSKWLFHRQS
ncbi:MAG: hypothetical protein ACPLY9_03475 [Nitrososphaerales archaeon]